MLLPPANNGGPGPVGLMACLSSHASRTACGRVGSAVYCRRLLPAAPVSLAWWEAHAVPNGTQHGPPSGAVKGEFRGAVVVGALLALGLQSPGFAGRLRPVRGLRAGEAGGSRRTAAVGGLSDESEPLPVRGVVSVGEVHMPLAVPEGNLQPAAGLAVEARGSGCLACVAIGVCLSRQDAGLWPDGSVGANGREW